MPEFSSLSELEKWIQTTHGQNSILDENHIKQVLIEAGHELEKLLKDELYNYFSSYQPAHPEYRRGLTVDSLMVGQPRKLTINEWELEITFDPSIANHPSVFGGDQPDGYTPWLLNSGWKTKLDPILNKENFTRFKGTNYITKAVDRFNETNKYGLIVEVLHNGVDVTGRMYSYGK